MKKTILAVTLLACLPSLILGIGTQADHDRQARERMMEERFEKWCKAEGIDYYGKSESERVAIKYDFWSETDDYMSACDSIDEVLSLKNYILNNP